MTTTAEKIEYIETRLALTEDDLKEAIDVINALQRELVKVKQSIKPAEPELLECWVNMFTDFSGDTYIDEYAATAELKEDHDYKAIHMREVTPQDEQDRKDAARYRWLKQNAETGRLCFDGFDNIAARDKHRWDEMIDKALR